MSQTRGEKENIKKNPKDTSGGRRSGKAMGRGAVLTLVCSQGTPSAPGEGNGNPLITCLIVH